MKKREDRGSFAALFFFAWFWRLWVTITAYQMEFLGMIRVVC